MDIRRLESLIPGHGKEVSIIAHHPTLGRGLITLLSPGFDPDAPDADEEPDDEDLCSEGMATFLPDKEPESQLLGIITPRDCACGRCLPFELVDHNGRRDVVREAVAPFIVVSRGWARA